MLSLPSTGVWHIHQMFWFACRLVHSVRAYAILLISMNNSMQRMRINRKVVGFCFICFELQLLWCTCQENYFFLCHISASSNSCSFGSVVFVTTTDQCPQLTCRTANRLYLRRKTVQRTVCQWEIGNWKVIQTALAAFSSLASQVKGMTQVLLRGTTWVMPVFVLAKNN